MSEISEEKKKIIAKLKQKIIELEAINEDTWTTRQTAAMNEIAIAKHYETISTLLKN